VFVEFIRLSLYERAQGEVMRVLREHFRPEFLNRVDDIVIYRPLGSAQMHHILELRLNEVRKLLADGTIHGDSLGLP